MSEWVIEAHNLTKVYQMGEVYARSVVVIGTFGSILMPKRFAS